MIVEIYESGMAYRGFYSQYKKTSAKCIEDSAKYLIPHCSINILLYPSINKFKNKENDKFKRIKSRKPIE